MQESIDKNEAYKEYNRDDVLIRNRLLRLKIEEIVLWVLLFTILIPLMIIIVIIIVQLLLDKTYMTIDGSGKGGLASILLPFLVIGIMKCRQQRRLLQAVSELGAHMNGNKIEGSYLGRKYCLQYDVITNYGVGSAEVTRHFDATLLLKHQPTGCAFKIFRNEPESILRNKKKGIVHQKLENEIECQTTINNTDLGFTINHSNSILFPSDLSPETISSLETIFATPRPTRKEKYLTGYRYLFKHPHFNLKNDSLVFHGVAISFKPESENFKIILSFMSSMADLIEK